jgi:serine/threonine-protein kinase
MPSPADYDLLFGVTALELRFITQEQLVAASAPAADDQRPLRARLCDQQALSAAEAEAVDAVVQQRAARFNGDARQALDSIGARTDPGGDSATHADRFITQGARAWTYSAQHQRFTVLRVHQQGGLGRLMIAQDQELNREIALKEILPALADSEDNRRRFIREAEITGALEHPGIVPVYSLGEFPDGRPYYAMRLVRGVDLRTAISDFFDRSLGVAERQLEFRQLLARFIDVCQAIHYAHNRGVIHRDVKPGNIMLGDYGETLVIDWGLAKTLDDHHSEADFEVPAVSPSNRAASDRTQAGRIVGTTQYMSPEQAEGRIDRLSTASDIYGLGATLYHILCGAPPFSGDEVDVVLRVQQGRFPRPRDRMKLVPRPLEAICLKAMARKPQDRYLTSRDLATDIERYLADEPVSAYAEPLAPRTWRWMRHHRTAVMSLMAATAVAVSALSAGIVLLSAANRRERDARDAATQSFREAEAQRASAERNFQLARQAVREFYVQVSEETLLNQVGMHPLRDALLRQALAYYKTFLGERQDDPQLRREVAQAQYYVGRITETIDSPEKALPHYEQAAALQKLLVDVAPPADRDAMAADYAQTLNAAGRALQNLQRLDEARQSYAEAAKIREQLAAAQPDDAERARALASSVMNLGLLDLRAGKPADAIRLLERAQSLRQAHRNVATPSPAMQRDVGMGYYNLALAQLQSDDADAAQASLMDAIEGFEQLATAKPHDMEIRRFLANCRRILADVQAAAGDTDKAIENYHLARQSLSELVLRNPDVPEYAADLAGVQMNLGDHLRQKTDLPAALEELQAAAATLTTLSEQETALPRHQRDLGVALRATGEVLLELDRVDEARQRLKASQDVLSRLVREQPADASYAAELKATEDALAELDAI